MSTTEALAWGFCAGVWLMVGVMAIGLCLARRTARRMAAERHGTR